jgi:curved DNA-binding protein CbpA
MNAYEILGVPQEASDDAIRAAFRKLALLWHPDHCKQPDAAERFREILAAKDELLDREQRQALDAKLARNDTSTVKRKPAKRRAAKRSVGGRNNVGKRSATKRKAPKPAAAAPPSPPVPPVPPQPEQRTGLFANMADLYAHDLPTADRVAWIFLGAIADREFGTERTVPPPPRR